jgi:hypothetical protein
MAGTDVGNAKTVYALLRQAARNPYEMGTSRISGG